jgi:hypothetical protein
MTTGHIPTDRRAEEIQSDPHLAAMARSLLVAAAVAPHATLDPREMIPDATLRRLAQGWPEALQGEIPESLQIELSILLPDLCGELLARRVAMDGPDPAACAGSGA